MYRTISKGQNEGYAAWMRELNELARPEGRIVLKNKFTWRAYRSQITPDEYLHRPYREIKSRLRK